MFWKPGEGGAVAAVSSRSAPLEPACCIRATGGRGLTATDLCCPIVGGARVMAVATKGEEPAHLSSFSPKILV